MPSVRYLKHMLFAGLAFESLKYLENFRFTPASFIRPRASVAVTAAGCLLHTDVMFPRTHAQTSHGGVEICFILDEEKKIVSFVSCPIIIYYCVPDRDWRKDLWLLVGATRRIHEKWEINFE